MAFYRILQLIWHSNVTSLPKFLIFFITFVCLFVIPLTVPMYFWCQILGRFNRARAAQLILPHYECQTPLFMPVGTQGKSMLGVGRTLLISVSYLLLLLISYFVFLFQSKVSVDSIHNLEHYTLYLFGTLFYESTF